MAHWENHMLKLGVRSLAVLVLFAGLAQAGELTKQGFGKLKKQVKVAIANGDDHALAQAISDLAQDDSKKAVDLILKGAMAIPGGKTFKATADALGSMTSDEAVGAISARVAKKGGHPGVKILCIDGLATHEDEVSGAALGAALSDKRPEVLRAALSAIRARKEVKAVEGLIDMLERLKKRPDTLLLKEVNTALAEITGKYFEKIEDWRKYWSVKKASFRPQTGGSLPAGLKTGERKGKVPTFFGTEVNSERLVFVIDTSGSMEGDRLQKCKDQLSQCIDALNKRSRFTIVSFSHTIKVWQQKLQPANGKTKYKAKEFISALKASGNTFTLSALKEGFKVKGADAMVVLSDGMPTETDNKGEMISEEFILNEVDGENRFKKWRIDCFGFENRPGGSLAEFMKQLAKDNGGTFTPIR
jgi:hypothetical protein